MLTAGFFLWREFPAPRKIRHFSSIAEGEMERWVLATIHETTPRGVYLNLSIATTMERMGDYTVVRFADGTNFEVVEEPLDLIRNIIKQP